MYAKKLKRKCMVRGCKCIDAYSISLTREGGNSIIICLDCLTKSLKAVKALNKEPKKEFIPSEPPTLFFNDDGGDSGQGVETPVVIPPAPVDDKKFICKHCGKECGSNIGLISHEKACDKKVDE